MQIKVIDFNGDLIAVIRDGKRLNARFIDDNGQINIYKQTVDLKPYFENKKEE